MRWINGDTWLDSLHIVRGPGFTYRSIPESTTQPFVTIRNAILHTNAGSRSAKSLWAWITQASVTGEPHFQVGYDGTEQYMPLNRRADCNYSANSWTGANGVVYGAASFESQDDGYMTLDVTPWNLTQIDAFVRALTLICVCYQVDCGQPATWDDSGIGHHSLFPYQGIGSKAWTNVRGKTCPGAARIRQMDWIRGEVGRRVVEYYKAAA
jgi:hypothetical protein